MKLPNVKISSVAVQANFSDSQVFRSAQQSNMNQVTIFLLNNAKLGGAKPKIGECNCTACSNVEPPLSVCLSVTLLDSDHKGWNKLTSKINY